MSWLPPPPAGGVGAGGLWGSAPAWGGGRVGAARLVGLGLGVRQRRVEPRQLLGALADALLEELVRALARLLGRDRLGRVGVGGDEAAARKLVGAVLDHPAGRLQPDALRFGIVDEAVDALRRHL